MTVRTRTRRALDVGEHPSGRDQIRALAEKFHAANKAKNAAARDEKKLQADLDKAMAKVGEGEAWGMQHEFTDAGGVLRKVSIRYEGAVKEAMDVVKLFTQVTEEVFLKIVSATRKNIETHAGKNAVNLCVITQQADFKASVKENK